MIELYCVSTAYNMQRIGEDYFESEKDANECATKLKQDFGGNEKVSINVKKTKWMSWDDFTLNAEMEKGFSIKFHKTSN